MLSVIFLNYTPNINLLSVIILRVISLRVVILSFALLSVVMLTVRLNMFMLIALAPLRDPKR